MQEILPVLQSWADQNEKEIDIHDQHLEKMLRKIYPGRQVECNNSSQHKIDQKIKGVNDNNRENQEERNITQDDWKTKDETQECDSKIHEHNKNHEEHEKIKKDTGIEKEKNTDHKTKKRKKL